MATVLGPIVIDAALGAELNAELRTALLARSQTSQGQESNNASGRSYFSHKWLSPKDLHLRPDPLLARAAAALQRQAEAYAGTLLAAPCPLRFAAFWAIVSRQGMAGRPHSHQGLISGAYYVEAGLSGQPGTGGLFLSYSDASRQSQVWQPRSDRLLLFSSRLVHAVSPYTSDQPRITLSFNLVRAT